MSAAAEATSTPRSPVATARPPSPSPSPSAASRGPKRKPAPPTDGFAELAWWRVNIRNQFYPNGKQSWFSYVIFFLILIACTTGALYDVTDPECQQSRCEMLRTVEMVLNVAFVAEIALYYVAFGTKHMLNPLRLFDTIVITANMLFVILVVSGQRQFNVSLLVIRVTRLLKPVFTTVRFRSVRVLVASVTRCLLQLTDVILLYVLFLMWFGVAGVYQFGGVLKTRCVSDEFLNASVVNTTANVNFTLPDYVCGGAFDKERGAFMDVACTPFTTCDLTPDTVLKGYRCPYGYHCRDVENPYGGHVGFDNLAQAALTVYTSVTFQLWYEAMFWASDSMDFIAYFYFVSLVVIGAYLIINLTVVIITVEFEKGKQIERDKIRELMAQATSRSGSSSFLDVVRQAVIAQKREDLQAAELSRPSIDIQMMPRPLFYSTSSNKIAPDAQATPSASASRRVIVPEDSQEGLSPLQQQLLESEETLEASVEGGAITLVAEQEQSDRGWRQRLHDEVVETKPFNYVTVLVIVANIGVLCSDHYGINESTTNAFYWLNITFTVFFTFEALLRFLSREALVYIKDFHNAFDLFIVVVSWIEILVEAIDFPLIRALRALRIVKLLKNYPALYEWILFIGAASKTSPLLLFFLSMICFVFATLALQIFGGRFCGLVSEEPAANGYCAGLPRANFDDFGHAMITAFLIVTADDWNFVMYDAMTARGSLYAIPFCVFFYVGNYILLNLLIAILLSASSEREDEAAASAQVSPDLSPAKQQNAPEASSSDEDEPTQEAFDNSGGGGEAADAGQATISPQTRELTPVRPAELDELELEQEANSCDAFYSKAQQRAQTVIESRITEAFIAVVILAGSLCMSLENPLWAPDQTASMALFYVDIGVTVVYTIELLTNILAYGFVMDKSTYLRRDKWNILDFVLVLISIAGVCLRNVGGGRYVDTLVALRALRPLRIVRHSPGMKLVLSSLTSSVVEMRNVVVVSAMIFVMWGICGVFLFKGTLRACLIGDEFRPELPLSNCTALGGSYENDGRNFDNIGEALLSLFQIATLEGWNAVMWRVMDAVDVDTPRERDHNPWASLYVIFMACFGGMFLVNLFVSVLIEAYNREKRVGSMKRSLRRQREEDGWLLTNKRIFRLLPLKEQRRLRVRMFGDSVSSANNASLGSEPGSPFSPTRAGMSDNSSMTLMNKLGEGIGSTQARVRAVIRSKRFLHATYAVIIMNFCAMAAEHYPRSEETASVFSILNIIFTTIFVLEAIVKIYGEGWQVYIHSRWNRLDFFVATVSAVSVAIESIYNPRATGIIRAVRVIRLARIARGRLEIDTLIGKFGQALAALGHVGAFIVIIFFVFAVMGMRMFGLVKWGPYGESTGIDMHANFGSIDSAMLILARMITGGNWADIMDSCTVKPPFCDQHLNECGVLRPLSILYFVVFMMVGVFVLKNLITAVLLDSFASSGRNTAIRKDHALEFMDAWDEFDPAMRFAIRSFDVLPFVRKLSAESALGFNHLPHAKRTGAELRFLGSLGLLDLQKHVPLELIVDRLCSAAFRNVDPPPKRSFRCDPVQYEPGFKFSGTGLEGDDETPAEASTRCAALLSFSLSFTRVLKARRARRERGKSMNLGRRPTALEVPQLLSVRQQQLMMETLNPLDSSHEEAAVARETAYHEEMRDLTFAVEEYDVI